MICDMIVAGEDAQFGQPEIKLGVMPGAGGTQRLTRAIGKAKAMELILTGRTMAAREAEASGLVTTVVPAESHARRRARAGRPGRRPAAARGPGGQAGHPAGARAVAVAGLEFERRAFFLLFASEDQTEGMAAFTEKRPAHWTGR